MYVRIYSSLYVHLSRICNCTKSGNQPVDNVVLHILRYTFWLYNCTNCDQLHVKICPGL